LAQYLKTAHGWSYSQIGRFLGGRRHTTIMELCKRNLSKKLV
jgi:chromosomal replication initiation ATPase DnaA